MASGVKTPMNMNSEATISIQLLRRFSASRLSFWSSGAGGYRRDHTVMISGVSSEAPNIENIKDVFMFVLTVDIGDTH